MIEKTFSHTDGISLETEKKMWDSGVLDWNDFLNKSSTIDFLPSSKIEKLKNEIMFSKDRLESSDINYFKEKIKSNEHWRLADCGKICFVDIETTGLSRWTDDMTMLGIYDGENARSYILGEDLEEAKEHLKQFDIIVTFNGKQFDLPFIEQKFNEKYDFIHLDLRFLLKEFGLAGGLKKIERELGIVRSDEVADVDGREAVRLWRRYQRGDEEALKILLKYNEEDIVNLKFLLNYYLDRKKKSLNLI